VNLDLQEEFETLYLDMELATTPRALHGIVDELFDSATAGQFKEEIRRRIDRAIVEEAFIESFRETDDETGED
jgi:hypothetical protein